MTQPTEEQMIARARQIAARNKSDPFAFDRAMCHIRAGVISLPDEQPAEQPAPIIVEKK